MPCGLELTSLGVDPAVLPFRGSAYVSEHHRAATRLRNGPGRGVRPPPYAVLADCAKAQGTEWISATVALGWGVRDTGGAGSVGVAILSRQRPELAWFSVAGKASTER